MKKFLSVLLIAVLLCGVGLVGANANAAPALVETQSSALQNIAMAALNTLLNSSMGDIAIQAFVNSMGGLQNLGFNVAGFLEAVDDLLPMAVKAALHDAGVASYPIWERDMLFYLIFRYLLFGWLWM